MPRARKVFQVNELRSSIGPWLAVQKVIHGFHCGTATIERCEPHRQSQGTSLSEECFDLAVGQDPRYLFLAFDDSNCIANAQDAQSGMFARGN